MPEEWMTFLVKEQCWAAVWFMTATCCHSSDAGSYLVGSTSKLMCSGVVMTPLNKGSSSFCKYAAPYTWCQTPHIAQSVMYMQPDRAGDINHFIKYSSWTCNLIMSTCLDIFMQISGNLLFFYLETEGHYFAGQAVSSEECLHGVGQLHLFGEHVP